MKLRSTNVFVAGFVVALGLVPQANAGVIRVLGIDTSSTWDYSTVPSLVGVDFTEISPTAFATAVLSDFHVLLISETFLDDFVTAAAQDVLDALNARDADIEAFLADGGGVVALSEPIGTGRFAWLPDPIEPILGGFLSDDTVSIVDPFHPVVAGLTDTGLSGWIVASHGNFLTTGGLDVLVDDGAGRPITLAGAFGLGRLVITDQDPDFHNFNGTMKPDQITFVQNAINWAAGDQKLPVPGTFWLLLFGAAIGLHRPN